MAFRITAAAATIMLVMFSASANAQAAAKTACKDGTTTAATGAAACEGHGGIHSGRTALLRRSPARKTTESDQAARVAQAGTPARADHSRPQEVRGWRWGRHHDKDEKHEKREANRHRVRCRDGRYEEMKEHGRGKGPEVCKHHGGLAH